MSGSRDPEILNIEEAAALLGVSVKTFNKVLHSQDLPARKIGREWKFSRQALIDWVGDGRSSAFYRDAGTVEDGVISPAERAESAKSTEPSHKRSGHQPQDSSKSQRSS